MTTTWHGWFGLGGAIKDAPAVVFPTPDTIDVYVRGMDDRLWQKWWDGAKWNPSDAGWAQHDDGNFRLGSGPAVVAQGAGFRDVYVRGQDGGVYHKFWDGTKWNGWFGLGGTIQGAPAVVNPTPQTIDIYVRGMDDRLWQKWWDGKKWNPSDSGWVQHDDGGFRLGSAPAVISDGSGFRDVYVRGQDGAVYHKFWDGTKWTGWFGLGGNIVGAPSVTLVHSGFFDIYARGTNNRLMQKWWDGQRWHPSDLGWVMHYDGNFRLGSEPKVASAGEGFRDVYVRESSGLPCHKFWNNQRHSNAQTIRSDAGRSAQIDQVVNNIVKPQQPGLALAVVKNGQIVHLAGYGLANVAKKIPITSETMFHMASTGKQFTGLGILMLAEGIPGKVKLDVGQPLGTYIPQLAGFGSQITIRRLLHHTSDLLELYGGVGLDTLLKNNAFPLNKDVIKTYADLGFPRNPNASKPGDEYVYSNSEYDVLGSVIESVSGQSYVDFFPTRVFEPLGMTDTFSFPDTSRIKDANCATGYEKNGTSFVPQNGSVLDGIVGAGSFYASVFDLCAYDEGLAKNMLVRKESLDLAYTSGTTNNGVATNYGFGWALGKYKGVAPLAEHGGAWTGFYSQIRRYRDTWFSVYVLANRPDIDFGAVVNAATDAYK